VARRNSWRDSPTDRPTSGSPLGAEHDECDDHDDDELDGADVEQGSSRWLGLVVLGSIANALAELAPGLPQVSVVRPPCLWDGFPPGGSGATRRSLELLAKAVLADQRDRLQPGVDSELGDDVLDVRARRLWTDHQ